MEGVKEYSACRSNRVYRLQEVCRYLQEEDRYNLQEEMEVIPSSSKLGIKLAGGKLNLQEVMGLYRPVSSLG